MLYITLNLNSKLSETSQSCAEMNQLHENGTAADKLANCLLQGSCQSIQTT